MADLSTVAHFDSEFSVNTPCLAWSCLARPLQIRAYRPHQFVVRAQTKELSRMRKPQQRMTPSHYVSESDCDIIDWGNECSTWLTLRLKRLECWEGSRKSSDNHVCLTFKAALSVNLALRRYNWEAVFFSKCLTWWLIMGTGSLHCLQFHGAIELQAFLLPFLKQPFPLPCISQYTTCLHTLHYQRKVFYLPHKSILVKPLNHT